MGRIVFFSRFLRRGTERHLGDQFPVRIDMPLFSDPPRRSRVVMLQRSAETGVFQHSPYRELMHSRCLLGPYREIIFIRRELLLQAFYYRRILEKRGPCHSQPRKNYLSLPR